MLLDGEDLGSPASVLLRGLEQGQVVELTRGTARCRLTLQLDAGTVRARQGDPAAPGAFLAVGREPVFIGGVGSEADLVLTDPRMADADVRLKRNRDGLLCLNDRSKPPLLRFEGEPVVFAQLAEGEGFQIGDHRLQVTVDGVRLTSYPTADWSALNDEMKDGAATAAASGIRRAAIGVDQIVTDYKLSVRLGSVTHDLDVHLYHPAATVADLLNTVGAPTNIDTLFYGDRPVSLGLSLFEASLPQGAVLTTEPSPPDPRDDETSLDRPFGLDISRQLTGTNTVPLNRPPRPGSPVTTAVLEAPHRKPPASPAEFSWALLVGAGAMAGLTWVITGDSRFAIFAGLSPILSLGTYFEQRRRKRKADAKNEKVFQNQLEAFRGELSATEKGERARLIALSPDTSEVLRRASVPSRRLWERRPTDDDFLQLNAGTAAVPWRPELKDGTGEQETEVAEALAGTRLEAAPVTIDLASAGVVGVVGDRRAALAVARSLLVQAAVQVGPADLTIGAFVDPGRDNEWEWVKWLPHSRRTQTVTSPRWTSSNRETSNNLLRSLAGQLGTRTCLLLIDSDVLLEGRVSPARRALGLSSAEQSGTPLFEIGGIVVATSADQLPAVCRTVIIAAADGSAEVSYMATDVTIAGVRTATVTAEAAADAARELARFDDPEHSVAGAGIPDLVRLLPLLELDEVDGQSICRRWESSSSRRGLRFPLGLTEQGVFELDLVNDGPHGLVAGTTGSGKSEFLRSLVLSLAASYDTTRLNLILIDFKGGAAFDVCASLPHVVGLVTNLNEQLANRALRALEAELHYRERLFAEVSVDNVDDYRKARPSSPLPRLLIVVDEFAMLAKDFPDVLESLVSVAAVGRTLGVYLLLATQRPAGVVSDDINANTPLRVALQVRSAEDSSEVIDVPDAAAISRHLKGRAIVRLGHDELIPLQTALVTTVSAFDAQAPLEAKPFTFTPSVEAAPASSGTADADRDTDSTRLVAAVQAAFVESKLVDPRRPWPEALGSKMELVKVAAVEGEKVLIALADDPGEQRQYAVGWDLNDGNLLLVGLPGSGTTSTLAALALTLAAGHSPESMSLVVLDAGTGVLAALARLPHTLSVVQTGERRRQTKLIRYLEKELGLRREARRIKESQGRIVVLIDNFAALQAQLDDAAGSDLLQDLYQVFRDGPQLGLSFAISADRILAVPGPLANVVTQKWMFRAADPYDYSYVGIPTSQAPAAVAGRAVMATTGLQIQVGAIGESLQAAALRVAALHPEAPSKPDLVRDLPAQISLEEVGAGTKATLHQDRWMIPAGRRESDLEIAGVVLHEGDHALIAGPPRSGKSATLATIATMLGRGRRDMPGLLIAAAGGSRSPLREHPAVDLFSPIDGMGDLIARALVAKEPAFLLIDDAETLTDSDGSLENLLSRNRPGFHLILAGRSASLRSLYAPWLNRVKNCRSGVLLQPDLLNGDDSLFSVSLRANSELRSRPGLGYLVYSGEPTQVQIAADLHA